MYSNLIYLFCHVLEEMIESTLLDLLGVLAIDAALLIAQAQHTFWMSRMFCLGFIFYRACVRIYFIHHPNMERLKVIAWLVTSMVFIHVVTKATPKLTKHRFECSSWLLQRPEAFLRYLHPFPSSRPKKVESMAWTWGLNGPILQYDAMMHHGGTGHLDLSRYLYIYIYIYLYIYIYTLSCLFEPMAPSQLLGFYHAEKRNLSL